MNQVRLAFLFLLCLLPAVAHADLWGFIDEAGKMHFAREKVDERYTLFVKDEGQSERPEIDASELKLEPVGPKLEDHIIYKRIQKSLNVKKFEELVLAEAKRHKLDPALVKAVIAVESAYDPAAISPKGAIGLMQLIPGTAERYGIKSVAIADPKSNIGGGTRYLRDLIDMFNGNLSLALAGYNAGEGAVKKYQNAIPPYPETQQYVKLVMQFYEYFGGRPGKVTHGKDGRVRLTMPGRRNLPPPPGESRIEQMLANDPRVQELMKPPAERVAP